MSSASVIVPTLNEGAVIDTLLSRFADCDIVDLQLLVSDGGSTDATLELAASHAGSRVEVVSGSPGRALQMNRAAAQARGEWLWFVHADSGFPQGVEPLLRAIVGSDRPWGRFDVRLDAEGRAYRVIESLMNLRSCLSGFATGDQGIFVRRDLFERVGGFPEQPLMEDIELSRRLKRHARPDCRRERLLTSARRWQRHGIFRTVLLMWRLRLAYWLGVSPQRLAEHYRLCSSPTHGS